MQKLKEYWILIPILLCAAATRLYNLMDMDYHHDELSALVRTRFASFMELILKGVMGDGHPAGTQIFLWGWTAWVGYEPWLVKLPFIVAGIWSVYLVFAIGKAFFGKNQGMVAAAMMAVLQYGITYSQWARPYALGLLCVLLVAYALSKFRNEHKRLWLGVFSITAALAGYIHYFALLQAVLISLSWWMFQPREDKVSIAKASVIAALLWLPHLPITINHLRIGGIGDWLKVPEPGYWLELLSYSFHFSRWLMALLAVAVVWSLFRSFDAKSGWVYRFILLCAVVTPYLIAWYYSVHVNALLHNGTMFFAFPFLVLLVASFIQFRKQWALVVFIGSFMLLGSYTLVQKREHLTLNLRTEYVHPFEWAEEQRKEARTVLLFDLRRDMVRMMAEKQLIDTTGLVFFWPLWEKRLLQDYLDTLSSERVMTVITASSPAEYLAAVIDHYPCIEAVTHYQVASAYVLSKNCDSRYRVTRQQWYIDDSPFYTGVKLHPENAFSPPITMEWSRFSGEDTFMLVRAEWVGADTTKTSIVAEIKVPDSTLLWYAADFDRFISHGRPIQYAYLQFELRDWPRAISKDDIFQTNIWHRGQDTVVLRAVDVFTYPGNPVKYKLFEE